MKKLIAAAFSFFFVLSVFAQGPITGFTPGKNHLDFAIGYSYEAFDEYFFGDQLQMASNINRSINIFGEYGINDSLSIVVNLPYVWIDNVNRGLQDGSFFLKFRNQKKSTALGELSIFTAVGATLPLSSYPTNTDNPIGVRATTFQARLTGQLMTEWGLFFHIQSGIDVRVSPNNLTSVPVLFRLGQGGKKWYWEAWMEVFHTFNSGTDIQLTGGTGSNWLRAGGTLYYGITNNSGLLVGYTRVINGRNIGKSNRVNAGAVYKF
ncbi:MAG: hypothetical protein AAFO07_04965 [Bacteroidota bacterium]